MKQARAFGVGVVVATQNPMDLDYRALDGVVLLQPRWAMSFMRGPMTRNEIKRAREGGGVSENDATSADKANQRPTSSPVDGIC